MEQQAAAESVAGQSNAALRKALAVLKVKHKALEKERDALQQALSEAEGKLAAE